MGNTHTWQQSNMYTRLRADHCGAKKASRRILGKPLTAKLTQELSSTLWSYAPPAVRATGSLFALSGCARVRRQHPCA